MPVGDEDAVPLETVVTSRFRCDGAVDGAFEVEYLLSITVPYLGFCRHRPPPRTDAQLVLFGACPRKLA